MKKLLILLFACTGCITQEYISNILPNTDDIPIGSKSIEVNGKFEYKKVFSTLLDEGFKVIEKEKEVGYLLAIKKSEADTDTQVTVHIKDNKTVITADWKPGTQSTAFAGAMTGLPGIQSDFQPAEWNNKNQRPDIAFATAVKFAKCLGEVNYLQ